ncbi:Calcium-binding mitochondrial carrier protein Aralar1, partial [Orchesella cincta]
ENNPWGAEERLKRASAEDLSVVFHKYASVYSEGQWFIKSEDFIRKFLGLHSSDNYHPGSVQLLAGIIDTSKDGLISFPEFQAFEGLLCVPDALYYTAFQLFDTNGNGIVSYDEFKEIILQTTLQQKIPFDLDGDFAGLYFGEKKNRVVTYSEFCQFLHDFHEEYGSEAFRRFDTDGTGFIDLDSFYDIMTTIRSHLLTKPVLKNMKEVVKKVTGADTVSYPFFMAFNSLLGQMELAKKVYLQASNGERDGEVTQDEFLSAANVMSKITPMQVDILFKLSNMINDSPTIIYSDLEKIAPEQYYKKVNKRIVDIKAVQSPEERSLLIEFLESVYRFTMGIAAGAAGAFFVYPMDLVKTRMQLQRPGLKALHYAIYKSNLDCLEKAYKNEGLGGLYRGLLPQLFGVAIGKALKLTINDFIRDKLRNRKGKVPLRNEIMAGGCAGLSNVFLANPVEAVKIRIQVAGEFNHHVRLKSFHVAKELGFFGLYRGLGACVLRDVPFCAIFFPAYAHLKIKFQDENGYNSPMTLLFAGILASIPGAPLSMPFDLIKTRLQAKPKPGKGNYDGILDATLKIYREEGFRAFWQGTRLIKPPSQFGVTLLVYEILQRLFYVDFAGTRPSGSEASVLVTGLHQVKSGNRDHIGGYALALPIMAGIESKFGLVFPKFKIVAEAEIISEAPA